MASEFVKKYRNLFNEDAWFWEQAVEELLVKHRDMITPSQQIESEEPNNQQELGNKINYKKADNESHDGVKFNSYVFDEQGCNKRAGSSRKTWRIE